MLKLETSSLSVCPDRFVPDCSLHVTVVDFRAEAHLKLINLVSVSNSVSFSFICQIHNRIDIRVKNKIGER